MWEFPAWKNILYFWHTKPVLWGSSVLLYFLVLAFLRTLFRFQISFHGWPWKRIEAYFKRLFFPFPVSRKGKGEIKEEEEEEERKEFFRVRLAEEGEEGWLFHLFALATRSNGAESLVQKIKESRLKRDPFYILDSWGEKLVWFQST